MDLLGEVLLSVRSDANSVGVFYAGERWGLAMSQSNAAMAVAYGVIGGPCWLLRPGQQKQRLSNGDWVLTLQGSPIHLVSSPDEPAVDFADFWVSQGLPEFSATSRRSAPIHFGFEGAHKAPRLLTIAYMLREPQRSPLLSMLPGVIVLTAQASGALAWLKPIVELLHEEGRAVQAGYLATATLVAELVLTSLLRTHVLSTPAMQAGWLRGLADARIGKALVAMHSQPTQRWTAANLAAEAGMSRAAFAKRFTHTVGQSPIHYLADLRMQLASQMVIEGRSSIAAIAEHLSYRSERAFRSAFRKRFNGAPLQYAKAERHRQPYGADTLRR